MISNIATASRCLEARHAFPTGPTLKLHVIGGGGGGGGGNRIPV